MWGLPSKEELDFVPRLYATEHVEAKDKLIYLHFFFGGSDWYVAEYDGDDLFFGYVILNGDYRNSEWGYFSFSELKQISIDGMEIDRDLHWQIRKAGEVDRILEARGYN